MQAVTVVVETHHLVFSVAKDNQRIIDNIARYSRTAYGTHFVIDGNTHQVHATLVGGKCVAQLYLYSHAGLIISIVRERLIRRT